MELRDLITFREIAKTKKFRLASESLNCTQPTLTARIKNLEDELGVNLFERTSQGVKLSEAGEVFLPHIKIILDKLDEATKTIKIWKANSQTTLLIGASFYVSCYELPQIISTFKEIYPNIHLYVRTGRSSDIKSMVENHEVQLGLARGLGNQTKLQTYKLNEEPIVLCTYPQHPLSKRDNILLQDIASEPLISYKGGYWSTVEKAFGDLKIKPNIAMELDSIEAIKKIIMETNSASLLPLQSVKTEMIQKQIKTINILQPKLTRNTYLYAYHQRELSIYLKAFVKTIENTYTLRNIKS
ncbi:MAG: LysR family transcriptional regulator [Peptococcaceae bacterium]